MFNIAANLMDRDLNALQPSQQWAGDTSYIQTEVRLLILRSRLSRFEGKPLPGHGNSTDRSSLDRLY